MPLLCAEPWQHPLRYPVRRLDSCRLTRGLHRAEPCAEERVGNDVAGASLPFMREQGELPFDEPQVLHEGRQIRSHARQFGQRVPNVPMGTASSLRHDSENGEVVSVQFSSQEAVAFLAQRRIGAQKEPLADLLRPWRPCGNRVQAVRFGEVAPILGHATEEGPQGQAALRGLGSVIAAYLEDRPEVPGAERQIERRASEQGCAPVVEQGFHLRLNGAEEDQSAGPVLVLKTVDLRLQERRQAAEGPLVADLELVEGHDRSRRAQRPHGSRYARQVPDRGRSVDPSLQARFPDCVSEHRCQVRRAAVGDLDQQRATAVRLILPERRQRLLDEGGLPDPPAPADGAEEPATPAYPFQERAQLLLASIEGPASAHEYKIIIFPK